MNANLGAEENVRQPMQRHKEEGQLGRRNRKSGAHKGSERTAIIGRRQGTLGIHRHGVLSWLSCLRDSNECQALPVPEDNAFQAFRPIEHQKGSAIQLSGTLAISRLTNHFPL